MLQDERVKALKVRFGKQKGYCPVMRSIVVMSLNKLLYDLS